MLNIFHMHFTCISHIFHTFAPGSEDWMLVWIVLDVVNICFHFSGVEMLNQLPRICCLNNCCSDFAINSSYQFLDDSKFPQHSLCWILLKQHPVTNCNFSILGIILEFAACVSRRLTKDSLLRATVNWFSRRFWYRDRRMNDSYVLKILKWLKLVVLCKRWPWIKCDGVSAKLTPSKSS